MKRNTATTSDEISGPGTKQMKMGAEQESKEDQRLSASCTSTPTAAPSSSHQTQPPLKKYPIHPLTKYDANKFPFFKQPREVGFYSLDKDRKLHHDARLRKFFFPPPRDEEIEFNLGHGYEKFRKRDDDVKERLDNILTWLVKNKHTFQDPQSQRYGLPPITLDYFIEC